jgi:predicted ATPase/DNA-binding XRE family transcriptional regulator
VTESLAEVLRLFRSTAHLSQEALAERAGISTRTVSDIETGAAKSPRLVTVMLLGEALGLATEDRARLAAAARRPSERHVSATLPTHVTARAAAVLGRDADVARLGALLRQKGTRLITLLGPAGVGKTSLAMRTAVDAAPEFECGAAVVELAPIADPSQVPAAVGHGLGLRDSAGDAVTAYLHSRNLLLVLDNLEHLTPAAPWIGELLQTCPRVVILATSREPLHLQTEQAYSVRPLRSDAAVALFVQRAQMVQPDFAISAANAAAIDTIVDHLEGLPLAIELAAPRLLLLPPKALAARLERRLPLLGDGAVDRPERQQTMHGAIAWSYDLLSSDEQRLFRRLAILRGGGSLDAAAAVAGDASDERSILFRAAPLVDKSMLLLSEDDEAEPRIAMLEMLREFAFERLAESGELEDARQRHAHYVAQFAQNGQRELSGAAQALALSRFEREHGNIRAALEWGAERNDALFGSRLVAAVWRFWWMHGHLAEGVLWIRRFLAMRAVDADGIPDALYGSVLRGSVVLLSAMGNFDEALAWCEQAIALQRRIGDDAGLGASLTSLGILMQHRGDYDAAEAAHAEGLELRRRLGDEAGMATSLSNLASTAFSKNDLARAAELGDESAAIYRRLGHESGLAHALMKIGLVEARRHNYDGAEELFTQCLRMQHESGDTGSTLYSLINLATVAYQRGDYANALSRYRKALDLLDSMPNRYALAKTLEGIAPTIAALGDPSRGARLFGAAEALRRAVGSPIFPAERAEYDAEIATVRSLVGDDAFDVQWRIGATVSLDRALEEARRPVSDKEVIRGHSR